MKKCFLLLPLFAVLALPAQSQLKIGPYYNFAASTLYGANGTNMSGMKGPDYSIKSCVGLGAVIQYQMKKNIGINFFSGYQQRGASFDRDLYSYSPKYRFNYLDVGLGLFYQTNEIIGKSKLRGEIPGTYHRLLNSERVNNYESYNIVNDSRKHDFGALVSVGLEIPMADVDVIYISAFANTGLQNVFSGVLADNKQIGKNFLFGLKVSYLLGCFKSTKND